jgi:four helix bundle protein
MDAPHKKLNAWKFAMDLVEITYQVTNSLPPQELYGLCSQMRRAAASVPSNIAEGATGRTNKEFKNYLTISLGSLSELDTQAELCFRLNFISDAEFSKLQNQINHTKSLIIGLKKSLV